MPILHGIMEITSLLSLVAHTHHLLSLLFAFLLLALVPLLGRRLLPSLLLLPLSVELLKQALGVLESSLFTGLLGLEGKGARGGKGVGFMIWNHGSWVKE